jgi:hypothetical protein
LMMFIYILFFNIKYSGWTSAIHEALT